MAKLIIKPKIIIENINKLNNLFSENKKIWSLIIKLLSSDKDVLKEIINNKCIKKVHSLGDSRLGGLRAIKKINPKIKTMYIKPPAITNKESIIKYADISVNSSFTTIKALNKEAKKQGKVHQIIIMIEMGELREGILGGSIVGFYNSVFKMKNIEVIGIGTNLGCMYGIEPTKDKLMQLSLYKNLLEVKFGKKLDMISGGSSITLPIMEKGKIPKEINHFRIGEAAFFGTSPLNNKKFNGLSTDTFEFETNIIELERKKQVPDGKITKASIGVTPKIKNKKDKSYRAIVDFGMLDTDAKELVPKDTKINFAGTTSDMSVYDLGENKLRNKQKYKIGDKIKFKPSYMAVAKFMSSRSFEKKILKPKDF